MTEINKILESSKISLTEQEVDALQKEIKVLEDNLSIMDHFLEKYHPNKFQFFSHNLIFLDSLEGQTEEDLLEDPEKISVEDRKIKIRFHY